MPHNLTLPAALGLLTLVLPASAPAQQTHTLLATPKTVAWGFYSAHAVPALTLHSGDTVSIQTLSTCGPPEHLEEIGIRPADIPQYVRDIYREVPSADKGPGGHILTGPVAVAEAEPGDVLEVRIQKITLDVPWSCNGFGAGRGFLPNDFPYSRSVMIPLDRDRMTADFAPGVTVPLHPFFGSMGVAPPTGGKYDSAPPWMHAGNIDNREMVAGTTLFIPVFSKGANFEVGDGHAGQGNGEVDITALETQLTGTFQLLVHKPTPGSSPLLWPRGETPTHYISMGFSLDLKTATEMAVRNMIAFLSAPPSPGAPTLPHLTRDQAYSLVSVACDVDVTQLVDGNVGAHVLCPKSLFHAK